MSLSSGLLSVLLGAALPVQAQDQAPSPALADNRAAASQNEEDDSGEIIVNGARPRGSVVGDIKPEQQLSPADIRSYGVSSISDLLSELAPQTNAGGGAPVVLLNGKRISGFSEIQDIPTEAISRVEILPEEVSLKYGYSPDQKVVNIVLRQRFRALTADLRGGTTTEGGRENGVADANLLRIHGDDRFNVDLKYSRADRLLESERDIRALAPARPYSLGGNITPAPGGNEIDPGLSTLAGTQVVVAAVPGSASTGRPQLSDFLAGANAASVSDLGHYRTLSPSTDNLALNAVLARTLPGNVSGSLNGRLELTDSHALQGLPSVNLLIPAGDPFSPFSNPVQLYRYLGQAGALGQTIKGTNAHLGLTLNGEIRPWRWSFTSSYDRVETRTATDRGINPSGLQTAIAGADPAVNPFGNPPAGLLTPRLIDTARARSSDIVGDLLLNGPLIALPAGKVTASIKIGAASNGFESRSLRSGVARSADFSRGVFNGQASIDIPIASRRSGTLGALGDLSVNGNFAVQHLSDFGTLSTVGYGLNWTPISQIRFIASVSQDRAAPSGQQIDSPDVVTPNLPVFDYASGRTVFVSQIGGGNPALMRSERNQIRLSLTVKPLEKRDLTLTASYVRSHTDHPIASFPVSTPQIEAAFPDRFLRDTDGTLLQVDARPINFARSRNSQLRWGFNLSLPIKSHLQKEIEAWRASGAKPEDRPADLRAMLDAIRPRGRETGGNEIEGRNGTSGSGSSRPGRGGFSGGRGGGGGGGDGGGRLQFALFHTWHFTDTVLVAPGIPSLDLLDGGAIGSTGGQPRHELQGQAGYTNNGLGARLSANWQSGTHVNGALGSPGTTLRFSSLATANLRLFANLGQMRKIVKAHPFFRGSRLSFNVTNLFDARERVSDGTGSTPLRYQSAYLDPIGRAVTISFRKLFY